VSSRIEDIDDAKIWIATHEVEQRGQWGRQEELNVRIEASLARIETRLADVERRTREMEHVQETVSAIHREILAMRQERHDEHRTPEFQEAPRSQTTKLAVGGVGLVGLWELLKLLAEKLL
jgi:hypothetical protein